MNQAQNHPKKNSTIKVEPIKEVKDIKAIKKLLSDNPRDFALFTIGINTSLRAGDLLSLTAGKVRGLKTGEEIEIKERKTRKLRPITMNKAVIDAIKGLLASRPYKDDDFLFQGQRGPITVSYLNRLVKGWCKTMNLKGNYGSHTLRKTFGYHKRKTFGHDIPTLMEVFNHSTQKQTLTYLCIQPEEVKDVYMNGEL